MYICIYTFVYILLSIVRFQHFGKRFMYVKLVIFNADVQTLRHINTQITYLRFIYLLYRQ